MSLRRGSLAILALLATGPALFAAHPPNELLAGNIRNLLLQSLPDPLYEDHSKWGQQKEVRRILRLPKQAPTAMRNDGHWSKVVVRPYHPTQTLLVDVRELQKPQPDRMTFTAIVAMDIHCDYDRQQWESGIRLHSAGLRARARVILALQCEVLARFEKSTGLIPDLVFRLRVLGSQCTYENLKVEHLAGLGGEAAEQLGKTFVRAMRQWKPSIERKLLDKANAAIVQAGDTKEVRIGLAGLMRQ
jgi:hypothetical protein